MFSKLEITGTIEVKTGMHIGASNGFAAIGAIDSPVAKDPVSALPYIPGSTLKGKMRSLLAKAFNDVIVKSREDDSDRITRLFGTSSDKNNNGNPRGSRLIFSDSIMNNREDLVKAGAKSETESKEENTINPITAVATPRQIERVIRGAQFPLNIIYNVEDEKDIVEDMESLSLGFRLLQYDYIGGHGSRGYGKIILKDLEIECVIGDLDEKVLVKCEKILKEK